MKDKPNSTYSLFAHGATWVRADFHMHTKGDRYFTYSGEENQFVRSYIQAMVEQDIRVGVITNHDRFDRGQFEALRKMAKRSEILLLPGVEFCVNDGKSGIHILIVFSPEWAEVSDDGNSIQTFLTEAYARRTNFKNSNGRSNFNIIDTIAKLDQYNLDYFIVCAHVEQRNGLWKEVSGGRLREIADHPPFRDRCLAFQKVRTDDERKRVKEQMAPWYPAEVEGSDCKSIEEIGEGRFTFIKIGAPTFDAVKYALSDYGSRVRKEKPKTSHSYIREVTFKGDKLDGTTLPLSPELNTLIGVRGSGKSSIIESIRYAIGYDLHHETITNRKYTDVDYKEELVEHALGSGGMITLRAVSRLGSEYEIRRIVGHQPEVYIEGAHKPGVRIRETVLHRPIYFGQKDLSNPEDGSEQMLVEKIVGDELTEVRQRIASKKQNVIDTVRRLQRLSDVRDKRDEQKKRKEDAEHRLRVFREHGIEERLKKQIDFDKDARMLGDIRSFIEGYIGQLAELADRYDDEFNTRRVVGSRWNSEIFDSTAEDFRTVSEGFAELKQILNRTREASRAIGEKESALAKKRRSLNEEFAEASRKLTEELRSSGATAIQPDEFLRLQKTVDTAILMLAELEKELAQRKDLREHLDTRLTELNHSWHEEYDLIHTHLKRINSAETPLKVEHTFKGDKGAFLDYLKDLFRGSNIRTDKLNSLTEEFSDGIEIYRDFDRAKDIMGTQAQAFEKYFLENATSLLTYQVPNRFTIVYHDKELRKHSLGQRASALILFVLNQGERDVVIIDQPEDDLDNQTIYNDVIKLVRQLKPETQFIFATHNPNIPVLGDAEQVISCRYSNDEIQLTTGSIDRPEIQESIVNIMEGGEEAFERRKSIYQAWKHLNS